MAFFDSKEEVLDIQLTQFGKQLLAGGKFRPRYYAFFDDDVLYDSEYGGFEEHRSDVGERVRNETPYNKVQYVFSGIETNFEKSKQLLRNDVELLAQDLQLTPEKHFTLSAPLGNSALTSENMPAWNANVLQGEITGAIAYNTGAHATLVIPQITLKDAEYKTSPATPVLGDDTIAPTFGDFADSGLVESDLNFATTRFEDGSYVKIQEDFILISVDEQNTALLSENFDIEVFIEEEDPKTGQEVLTQLFFDKKKNMVDENNVLLEQEVEMPENIVLDASFVEHFFHVYVDNEISKGTLCKLVPEPERETVFANGFLDCETLTKDISVVDVSGLYDSDVIIEDLEDDCLE